MVRPDPHSYADDSQPNTERMRVRLWFDFDQSEVRGDITLELDRPADGVLDLDTRDLRIDAVTSASNESIQFELAEPEPTLGARLRVFLTGQSVHIVFRTAPGATALQWLSPRQTAGQLHPFVFTQCQAIHARSVLPCQDTPRVRARYVAELNVPAPLSAVMAAATGPRHEEGDRAVCHFEMPQPIPSYLFAFAVGDLASTEIGPRTRIYAEPAVLAAAEWEFAEVDEHLSRAETLFGPYPWDRFDILVMPPSFPYGGMENPRLTFVTPSLLAGDRSLVSVVAHELAHSWTGNLVTNASMNHFWLNEGFTVYAERRIVEALYGEATRTLQAAVGRVHLEDDIVRLSKIDPRLTQLRVDLSGHDPDDVFSTVPYEKGYLFLVRLEHNVGRARFDAFLKAYIDRFRFRSIVTDDLLAFLTAEFADVIEGVDIDAWIDGQGLPADAPRTPSERLDAITALAKLFEQGTRPDPTVLSAFSADEWQAFLSALPPTLPEPDCAWFESTFGLSRSTNPEIRVGWLVVAARSGFTPVFEAVKATLLQFGRMKYLRPLYAALVAAGPTGRAMAASVFAVARDRYHPVAQNLVRGIVS